MADCSRSRRWDVTAVVCLVVGMSLLYWPLITPDQARRASFPEGDFYDQFYAFARYEHSRLWAGELPLWNPYTFGGHPFLADIQSAVFYPPSLLVMLLSGPGEFSPQWLIAESLVHTCLGALLTYLFVRRLTAFSEDSVSIVAAVLSALTFGLGGYLTSYPPLQLAVLETQVWLPLILLLLDLGIVERRWTPILGAGVAWGVALLAGHPQSAMYVVYCALAYGLFRTFESRRAWIWRLAANVTWIVIGVGIAAVQVLPSWEFMQLSVRSGLSYEELKGGFALRDLVQAFLPGVLTLWSPVYVGIGALVLVGAAFLGAFSARGNRSLRAQVIFWGLLVLVSTLLSLGGNAFLYPLFYRIVPGFNLFRSQERAIYLASFGLSILAGYGWAWLSSDGQASRARWVRLRSLSLSVLATGTAIVAWVLTGTDSVWFDAAIRFLALSWATWALLRWCHGRRYWWGVLSVLLVVLDLVVVNRTIVFSPAPAGAQVYDSAWLEPVFETEGLFRIVNGFGLPGNAGCWLDLEDMAGASPLRLQAHKVMMDGLPRWRMWQLFDVRYVVTWEHDLPGPLLSSRIVMQGTEWEKNTVYVHRLEQDFARAWVVHRARTVGDADALAILATDEFDPFDEVLLSVPVRGPTAPVPVPPVVRAIAHSPREITVWANLSAAGWLVLGEWFYPGWQVWVDGTRETLLRANYGLRAVALDPGEHQIVFRFCPLSVIIGAVLSGLTSVCVLALLCPLWRRERWSQCMRDAGDANG